MTLVSTPAELTIALAAAVAGEVIDLAPGNYGSFSINRIFPPTVTMRSQDPADPAVFTSLTCWETSNLVLDSFYFKYTHTPGDVTWIKPFQVLTSQFVTIRNTIFEGSEVASDTGPGAFGFGIGLFVRYSDNITIEFNEFFNFERGVNVGNGSSFVFLANDIYSCRSEGIDLWDMHGVLIEGCYFHDLKKDPSKGDHPDMIQFWDVMAGQWSEDVTIRANYIDAGDNWTQSIFLQNGSFDGTEYFRNFLVEHNVIYNAHTHGITCEGGFDGLVIRNNTMLYDHAAFDATNLGDNPPFINVNQSNLNVSIQKNLIEKRWDWDAKEAAPRAGWVVGNQFFMQRSVPAASNSYSNLFVNALAVDPTLADLRAVAGGEIEVEGYGADMTRFDIPMDVGPGGTVAPPSDPPPPPPPPPPPEETDMLVSDLVVDLIDADLDVVVQTLNGGDFVDPVFLASGSATIAVVAAPSAPAIGSVRLTVGPFSRLESASPYALFGDSSGNFTGGLILAEGPYVLRLEVYEGSGGSGAVIGDFLVDFTVGVDTPPPPPPPPSIDPDVQAALDALAGAILDNESAISANTVNLALTMGRVSGIEASMALNTSEIASIMNRVASFEDDITAVMVRLMSMETGLTAAEARLAAGSAGLAVPV